MALNRVRGALVLVASALVVTAACSSSSSSSGPYGVPDLPKKVATSGDITSPAMKPAWLVEAIPTDEASIDTQYDTRAGAIVSKNRVLLYSVDRILGVSRKTGRIAWTSKLDMEAGSICQASRPSSEKKTWVAVVYSLGESFCNQVATIDVKTGKVLGRSELGGGGSGIGDVAESMVTVGDTDYLADSDGQILTIGRTAALEKMTTVPNRTDPSVPSRLQTMARVPGEDLLVVQSSILDRDQFVAGLHIPDLAEVWRVQSSTLVEGLPQASSVSLVLANGLFMQAQSVSDHYLFRLDPRDGSPVSKVLATKATDTEGMGGIPRDVEQGDQINVPDLIGVMKDDLVVQTGLSTLSRFSTRTGKDAWSLDTRSMTLGDAVDPKDSYVRPGPLLDEGTKMFSVHFDGTSADLLLLDTKDGSILGRWAFPDKYVKGLADSPYVYVTDDGILLVRNRTTDKIVESLIRGVGDEPPPEDGLYDAAFFTFPEVPVSD